MNCKTIQKTIDKWLNGELAPEASRAMESHVAACPDCAAAVRFRQRVGDQLSGRAVTDVTMRYRLATELDEIDAGRRTSGTWALFGANLMKKTLWPATAAAVAFGTYLVIAPQGALAEDWKNRLVDAKESVNPALPSDINTSVIQQGDLVVDRQTDEDVMISSVGGVTGVAEVASLIPGEDLTDADRAFMGAFELTIRMTERSFEGAKHEWSVKYDEKKYRSVKGEKAGVTYYVPRDNDDYRLVARFDPKTNELDGLTFEKRVDGKWTAYAERMPGVFVVRGDGFVPSGDEMKRAIELELQGLEGLRGLKGLEGLKELESLKELEKLKGLEHKELSEAQKRELEAHMKALEKELKEHVFVFGSPGKMSDEERKAFEKSMRDLQESMKGRAFFFDEKAFSQDHQKAMEEAMKSLREMKPRSDEERKALEKAMEELRKSSTFKLRELTEAERKAMDESMKQFRLRLDEGDAARRAGIERMRALELSEVTRGGAASFFFSGSDGVVLTIKKSADGEAWSLDYDRDRFREERISDKVTHLIDKKDANRRVVVTREAKDGAPVKVEMQTRKDGKWVTSGTSAVTRANSVAPRGRASGSLAPSSSAESVSVVVAGAPAMAGPSSVSAAASAPAGPGSK